MLTTVTAVWKDDDAEVIIRKITHMSRSGNNRQSVSGIGGELCVQASVCLDSDCESTSVWVQQCDLGDRENAVREGWRVPLLSLPPPASHQLDKAQSYSCLLTQRLPEKTWMHTVYVFKCKRWALPASVVVNVEAANFTFDLCVNILNIN